MKLENIVVWGSALVATASVLAAMLAMDLMK
jgi:hypothetical protein